MLRATHADVWRLVGRLINIELFLHYCAAVAKLDKKVSYHCGCSGAPRLYDGLRGFGRCARWGRFVILLGFVARLALADPVLSIHSAL